MSLASLTSWTFCCCLICLLFYLLCLVSCASTNHEQRYSFDVKTWVKETVCKCFINITLITEINSFNFFLWFQSSAVLQDLLKSPDCSCWLVIYKNADSDTCRVLNLNWTDFSGSYWPDLLPFTRLWFISWETTTTSNLESRETTDQTLFMMSEAENSTQKGFESHFFAQHKCT